MSVEIDIADVKVSELMESVQDHLISTELQYLILVEIQAIRRSRFAIVFV